MNKKNFAPSAINTICHPEFISGSDNKIRQWRFFTGFTLIELLVVIVIIGILATISVAQFNDYQERARLARAISFAQQSHLVLMTGVIAGENPLVAEYTFNNSTITDSSGNQNDPSTIDSGVLFSTDTPFNSGFSLDLEDDESVIISNPTNVPTQTLTLSAWVKFENEIVSTNKHFLRSENIFPSSLGGWSLNVNSFNRGVFRANGNTDNPASMQAEYFKADHWYHYLATYNGSERKIYIDGEKKDLLSGGTESSPVDLNFISYALGMTSGTDSDIIIDNVRIYKNYFEGF